MRKSIADFIYAMQMTQVEELAQIIRSGKLAIPSRSAILESSERYDLIRGKDFVRWFQAHMDIVTLPLVRGA